MSRRRALMSQRRWAPVSNLTWTLGKNISEGGARPDGTFAAYSSETFCGPGTVIKRTGSATDGSGHTINCYLHEYLGDGSIASSNWIRRTSLQVDSEVVIGANTTNVRFTFAFASTSGLTMTQNIINSYFGAEIKEAL